MVNIRVQLDNDDHYVGGNNIQYIVIHGTGNKTDSDEGNANYFCGGNRQSSAHYFVDDDSITQLVKDLDGAWHCGDGGNAYGINNRNSLGVEMCCTNYVYTETTQKNTIELVVMLMKKYNVPIERVVRHYDASRKNCPSGFNLDGKWTGWVAFKNKLAMALAPKPVAPVAPVAKYGVVTASTLNVRSGRGTSFPVIGTLQLGAKVRLDTKMNEWYSIYFGDHGGFVSAQYIKEV